MNQKSTSQVPKTLRLQNVRTQQQAILQEIARLTQNSVPDYSSQKISKLLSQTVTRIEQLCAQQQLVPANLPETSRQSYAWMKFLLNEHHLLLHVQATRRVQQLVAVELLSSATNPLKKSVHVSFENLNVEFINMAGLYKYKSNSNCTLLQIHEGFIAASDPVFFAIVQTAVLGKSSVTSRVIRSFSLSEEFSEVLLEMELMVESIAETPKGQAYDLNVIFETVNRDYFASRIPKPRLTWNQVITRRKFGHYDPVRDRVVVSRTLDNRRVPQYVVEFVMYHELLHKKHGQKWEKSRLICHTPEFRRDEHKFKRYEQAQQWLGKMAAAKMKPS